jgi:hypothetical protein
MSSVTNLLISFSTEEDDAARMIEVNKYFSEPNLGLVSIHDPKLPSRWYGGRHFFEANLYVGAFNENTYFNLDTFIEWLTTKVNWSRQDRVQLMINAQAQDTFELLTLSK